MIRHMDIAFSEISRIKEEEPERYRKLINEGMLIGLGLKKEGETETISTIDKVVANNRPDNAQYAAVSEAVFKGEKSTVVSEVKALLGSGEDPSELVIHALMPGIQTVCELYDIGECFVPEILLANEALIAGVTLCQEKIGDIPKKGNVISLVIEGDLHDIGKNIMAAILRANGYDVRDLGRDVTVGDVKDAIEQENAQLVTGTTLMSTTKGGLKNLAKELESYGVPLACGGAAVDKHFVESFENSIYGKTPLDAVKIANSIVLDKKNWQEARAIIHK